MKKILLILLLICNRAFAQYHVIRYERETKSGWDISYTKDIPLQLKSLTIFYVLGVMMIKSNVYKIDIASEYTKYENGVYVSTSWKATDPSGLACKILFTSRIIKVIYNDNGFITSNNYYLRYGESIN